ncbi:hypothetical protein LCGC14_2326010 [marine sediment metagenome]|uniref:Uncharacterized protein n=1 Tax=marine sediment metagenome TaxID=412755 RepID=A0A0F9CH08_9ZZZZ
MSHFEFQPLAPDGRPTGLCVSCTTVAGVILQCPSVCDPRDIEHLCEIARAKPDHPVDLTAQTGPENARRLPWSARLHYRE